MAKETADRRPHTRPRSRRGSIYVAVLGISMLVLVLGLGGLASARAVSMARSQTRDLSGARWAAASGIDLARFSIQRESQWRTKYINGAWFTGVAIGDARVTVDVTNPSGALNRSPTDPVVVTATAEQGAARHAVSVTLEPSSAAYTSLDVSLCAGGAISATSATVNASGYTIATNNAFTALLCSINANVEASLTAVGLTVNGSVTSLAPQRTMPRTDVFDHYIAHGTVVAGSFLPLRSGSRSIYRQLVSPAHNPYTGELNTQGIYVLNGGNAPVVISESRIVGTLFIFNATSVTIDGSVAWEPAVRGYPCLLVDGNLTLSFSSSTLGEPGSGMNFNPATAPFPYIAGYSNTQTNDSFPSAIDGLVYVSGNLTVSGSPTVTQIIAGGSVNLGGSLTLGFNSEFKRNPPPGFAVVTMRPQAGSRRQVVQ